MKYIRLHYKKEIYWILKKYLMNWIQFMNIFIVQWMDLQIDGYRQIDEIVSLYFQENESDSKSIPKHSLIVFDHSKHMLDALQHATKQSLQSYTSTSYIYFLIFKDI